MTTVPVSTTDTDLAAVLDDLRRRVAGDVLVPGDPGYDESRLGWNRAFVSHPAVVVVAASTDDVVEAVRAAAALDLGIAVQGTGHGPGAAADGAMMIVTARLTGVDLDVEGRTARVQAGAKWGAVLAPAQEHGLAPLLGSTTDVGVVGYTLGGGMGWLARHHGLASDSVVSFDVVLPDGVEVTASADVHADLFWALKGGGAGTLGVVTAVELRLFPVSTVYAGNLFYPADAAADVYRFFRGWTADLPEEMTSAVTLINFPPIPDVPEPLRGNSFVLVRGAWSGADLSAGKALVDRWRAWREPLMDLWGPMPFAAADSISTDPVDPMPAMSATESFDVLDDAALAVVAEATFPAPGMPPALVFSELRHAGGAVRRGAAGAVNDRSRSAEYVLYMIGVPMAPEAVPALRAHLDVTRERLAPWVSGAAYLNFLDGDDRRSRAVEAFGAENLARLRRVKQAVDPAGRFGYGFGLAPQAGAGRP